MYVCMFIDRNKVTKSYKQRIMEIMWKQNQ